MNIKKYLKLVTLGLLTLVSAMIFKQSALATDSQKWMSKIPDQTKLCNLNIPGTHNSGTAKTTAFTSLAASCQSDSIPEQLQKGIRCLDIKLNSDLLVNNAGVSCYKNTFDKLYFSDVLNYVSSFLEENPSETVIIQIKQEGDVSDEFQDAVNGELAGKDDIYMMPRKNPATLTLGNIRGKMLVFTRSGDIASAYRYDRWADNCACWQIDVGGESNGILQDTYKDKTTEAKIMHITDFYSTVWEWYSQSGLFYINFMNCVGSHCPKLVAKEINKFLKSFIEENNKQKFGVVMMDNPDSSLIHNLYSSNYCRLNIT